MKTSADRGRESSATGVPPPKFPDSHSTYWLRKLLLRTRTPDEETADAILAELVRERHRRGNDRRALPEEQVAQAVYRVRQRTWGEGSDARQYLQLLVVFPSREVGATLRVALAEGPAAAAARD